MITFRSNGKYSQDDVFTDVIMTLHQSKAIRVIFYSNIFLKILHLLLHPPSFITKRDFSGIIFVLMGDILPTVMQQSLHDRAYEGCTPPRRPLPVQLKCPQLACSVTSLR